MLLLALGCLKTYMDQKGDWINSWKESAKIPGQKQSMLETGKCSGEKTVRVGAGLTLLPRPTAGCCWRHGIKWLLDVVCRAHSDSLRL